MKHLSETELLEYLLASDSAEARERVEGHLASGCVRCIQGARRLMKRVRETGRRELRARGAKGQPWAGVALLEQRSEREVRLVELEREVAPALVRELLLSPPEARRSAIRTEGRFGLYGLAEGLTDKARAECFADVARAVELAELAVEVADAVDPRLYPPGMVADGRALAWAALANARRVRGDLVEADRAMGAARGLAAQGSQDSSVLAELGSLEGSLRIDQARFDEAVEVLERSAEYYRRDGNRAQEGKVLFSSGMPPADRGDVDGAISSLERARELLSVGGE